MRIMERNLIYWVRKLKMKNNEIIDIEPDEFGFLDEDEDD